MSHHKRVRLTSLAATWSGDMLACALLFLDPVLDWPSVHVASKTWNEALKLAAARLGGITLDLRVPRVRRFLAEASPRQWTTTWVKHMQRVAVLLPAHWEPLSQLPEAALQHLALLTRAPNVVDVAFHRIGEPTHRKLMFESNDQDVDIVGSAYTVKQHAAAVFPVLPLRRLVLDGLVEPSDLFTRFPMVWGSSMMRELHLGTTQPDQWLSQHIAWMRTHLTSLQSLRIDDLGVDGLHLFGAPFPCYLNPTIVSELAAWTTLDFLDLAGDVDPEKCSRQPVDQLQWTPTSVRFGLTDSVPTDGDLCVLELVARRRVSWPTVTMVVDDESDCVTHGGAVDGRSKPTRRIAVSNRLVVEPAMPMGRRTGRPTMTEDQRQLCKTWIDSVFTFEPGAAIVFL